MTPEFVRTTYLFEDSENSNGTKAELMDPAIDKANLRGFAVYASILLVVVVIAWLVYLLFRPKN